MSVLDHGHHYHPVDAAAAVLKIISVSKKVGSISSISASGNPSATASTN